MFELDKVREYAYNEDIVMLGKTLRLGGPVEQEYACNTLEELLPLCKNLDLLNTGKGLFFPHLLYTCSKSKELKINQAKPFIQRCVARVELEFKDLGVRLTYCVYYRDLGKSRITRDELFVRSGMFMATFCQSINHKWVPDFSEWRWDCGKSSRYPTDAFLVLRNLPGYDDWDAAFKKLRNQQDLMYGNS